MSEFHNHKVNFELEQTYLHDLQSDIIFNGHNYLHMPKFILTWLILLRGLNNWF